MGGADARDWSNDYSKQSLLVTRRPPAAPDGTPRHLFLIEEDESALSKKLLLYGGSDGVVSFEGMLTPGLDPVNAPKDSACDIGWLLSYQAPPTMAYGNLSETCFSFFCIPKEPYTDRMPTGADIVEDLCYSGKFSSSKKPDINCVRIPFVDKSPYRDYSDVMHTDREKQRVFDDQETANSVIDDKEEYEAALQSVKAHVKLEEYVKDKHLYYAIFHTKEHAPLWKGSSEKQVYVFAVGVSPHGNLVGVIGMNLAINMTGSGPVPQGIGAENGDDEGEAEDEKDDGERDGEEEEQDPDPQAIMVNGRPGPLPDGSPQHIFYHNENESSLSSKLMLHDGHKGVVTFEGMLPAAAGDETELDVVWLRSLLDAPLTTYYGQAEVPVFPFICIPDDPYANRMPSKSDIIRDLRIEANYCDEGRGEWEANPDDVHTDRDREHIFATQAEVKRINDDDDADNACKEHARKSFAAHEKLEAFVKDRRLHYALFHTRPHHRLGPPTCDYCYLFAVGVSPKTGNLVGVFSMQVAHNFSD